VIQDNARSNCDSIIDDEKSEDDEVESSITKESDLLRKLIKNLRVE
jgi:hypothetical protein